MITVRHTYSKRSAPMIDQEKKANTAPAPASRSIHYVLNGISVVLVVFFVFIAQDLLRTPDVPHIILLLVFSYAILRIVYEITWKRGSVPTLATGLLERRKISALLRQHAASSSSQPYRVVDLGSGRGELTRHIARSLPQASVTGIEFSPLAHRQAVFMQRLFGPQNIDYRQQDFFSFDCRPADAVVLFLTVTLTRQVGEKLWKELKPGALVICNEFPMQGDWPEPEAITFHTPFRVNFFVYRKP